ncbi:hypothetical protein D3C83_209770 [compost metagenome]
MKVIRSDVFKGVGAVAFFLSEDRVEKIPGKIGIRGSGFQHLHQETVGGLVHRDKIISLPEG